MTSPARPATWVSPPALDAQDAAEQVAAAAAACPGVAQVRSGALVPVATYLPGRRVDGVRLDGDRVSVAVVMQHGTSAPVVAAQVRSAVRQWAAGRPVDVHVVDVRLPGQSGPAALPAEAASPPEPG